MVFVPPPPPSSSVTRIVMPDGGRKCSSRDHAASLSYSKRHSATSCMMNQFDTDSLS